MEFLILVLIGLVSIFLITKHKSVGLIYALIFLLPFRFEVFSLSGIGIRTTDLFALIYLMVWVLNLANKNIKKSDLIVVNSILLFAFFVSISFLVNALRFGIISNLIDYIRFFIAITTGIAISTTVKTKANLVRLFIVWMWSAGLTSIITIIIFISNGYGISTVLNLNNLSVAEFYAIKFSNSIFFEDPNNLASYLIISFFITLGLIAENHIVGNYKFFMLSIQSIGLILTMSRSAYLSVGLGLLIYMLAYNKRDLKWMIMRGIILIVLVFVANAFFRNINNDVSVMSRFGLWQVGINMTLANPVIGVGIGNSSVFFDEFMTSTLIIYNPHFHNLYLKISSEFGIIGIVLFFSMFTRSLFDWQNSNDKLYVFLAIGLMAFLIQSMGVEYFSSRHFWIFLPLLMQYRFFLKNGGGINGIGISSNTCL